MDTHNTYVHSSMNIMLMNYNYMYGFYNVQVRTWLYNGDGLMLHDD
jgi:hypothetical protein